MGFIKNARQRLPGTASDFGGGYFAVYSGTANAGTPADGTAGYGAGTLEKGALVLSNGGTAKLYQNTNTKASPTWSIVGSQS